MLTAHENFFFQYYYFKDPKMFQTSHFFLRKLTLRSTEKNKTKPEVALLVLERATLSLK